MCALDVVKEKEMDNTKIILFVVLSIFVPFVGIPLLIISIYKDNKQDEIVEQNSSYEEQNEQDAEKESKQVRNNAKFSLKTKQLLIPIIIAGVALFILLLGIILILTVNSGVGKVLLQCAAFIEIIGAIVGIVLAYRKMYYTCPECGTKREHHKKLVDTKTQTRNQANNTYRSDKSSFVECLITSYRYKYCHSYVCPKCGEVETTESWEDGGAVYHYIDDMVVDKRKQPKEF